MKRFVLIISAILLSFAARAQSVTYTCRYWFDQNDAQAVITTFNEGTWQAELDVGTLSNGLHTLHVQAVDTSAAWCPPLSYMFFKSTTGESLLDSVDMGNLTYHCWFDQDHAHQQTGALGSGGFLFDVDGLGKGLHSIHILLEGSDFTSSQSYMFFKLSDSEPLLDSVDMGNLTYHCWFDQDHAHQQTGNLANGSFLFDVSNLEEGPHSLNVMLEGSTLTASQSYMFVKIGQEEHLIEPIDMSHLVYHCWFDQDYENRVVDSVSNGAILLDLGNIADGMHTVHIMLEGEAVTSIESYMFVKMPQQNSLIEPIDMSNLAYQCWFDQDYEHRVTAPISNGIMLLDVDNLSDGLHSVHILLEGEALTSTLTYLFFIKPEQQDFGIAKWQYLVNGDLSHLHTTEFSQLIDTLDIVTLLPVETWPVRSSCFHFHPNGDEPYLNAKNEVTFRFWSNDDRVLLESAFYVDYKVQQDIVANVFERNTTETFTAPRNNQIQWFKLDVMAGDSLAFVADKTCTMQLFAPSGEEVYAATASEAMVLGGCHAWENGTYFLAVHDVTGSGETISVTYNWIYRYAVLAYDVHQVGNGGCSTITFQGNGFNSLLDVYLVNAQNDTIRQLHIGHESNTTSTVSFNFYEVNLGVYDAVFEFYGETINIVSSAPDRANIGIEVQEPMDIALVSMVSYPSRFLRNSTCTYTYAITNSGNMTAYSVPIYLYISTESFECISHIKIDGLDLYSLKDYLVLDSLSQEEKEEIERWSKEMGDDHYFFKTYSVDETTGDSVLVRSNYFFTNLAPHETKEIKVNITSVCSVDVAMTIPTENGFGYYLPLIYDPNNLDDPNNPNNPNNPGGSGGGSGGSGGGSGGSGGGSGGSGGGSGGSGGGSGGSGGGSGGSGGGSGGSGTQNPACCANDVIQCTLNLVCDVLDIASLIPGAGLGLSIANCICGMISLTVEQFAKALCDSDNGEDYWDASMAISKGKSITGTVIACIQTLSPAGKLETILDVAGKALTGLTIKDIAHEVSECADAWDSWENKKADCYPGETPSGGTSISVYSFDPNEIHGYLSESGSHYMRQEIQNVQYEIEFENDTTLANAAAHTIIVRDTLDATKFDLNSLAARSVTIGDKRLELNGEQTFARTLDMRPELYVIAQIEQDYDPTTGIVEWTIQSLDPMTMEPTDNPYQGVLPVNYSGNGVGFIDYSINLKQAFADGTAISNRAGIIFDQNEVIMTPTWTNIVDAVKPVSYLEEVTFEADTLNFSFVSSDNRSGVWYHSLYYRNEATEQEWKVKVPKILENNCLLHFDEYQTTEYLVMAVDSAGNVEDKEMVAEYIHYYDGPAPVTQTINLSQGWNWISTYIESSNLLEQLETNLGSNGIEIWSNSNSTEYDEEWGWFGDLDDIGMTNEEMYMVKTKTSCSMQLQGLPANPANYAITINPGWNWIGFPCNGETTLEEALSNFEAEQGDQIWSSSFSTEYDDGWGWFGDIDTLVPGEGYMYYSNSTHPKTLIFQTGSKAD